MANIDLAALTKMLADYQPPLDPFNGATRVFFGSVAYDQIVPLMHAVDRRRVSVEVRQLFPPDYGIGFRPSRDDDPEWQRLPDFGTLVWVMSKGMP